MKNKLNKFIIILKNAFKKKLKTILYVFDIIILQFCYFLYIKKYIIKILWFKKNDKIYLLLKLNLLKNIFKFYLYKNNKYIKPIYYTPIYTYFYYIPNIGIVSHSMLNLLKYKKPFFYGYLI